MSNDPQDDRRVSFLASLNLVETLALAAISLVALAGFMMVGKGVVMKTTVDLAKEPSAKSFQVQSPVKRI